MNKELLAVFDTAFSNESLQKIEKPSLFFGRKSILNWLDHIYYNPVLRGIHIGVYGVRRCGKTTLVQHFVQEKIKKQKEGKEKIFYLSVVGNNKKNEVENVLSAKNNLKTVLEELFYLPEKNNQNYKNLFKKEIASWQEFFNLLLSAIKIVQQKFGNETRLFLFFDEVAWLSKNNRFLIAYSDYLNQSKVDLTYSINFLACSSNSWMRSNVFKDSKGLYARFKNIEVKPFSFAEMVEVFKTSQWDTDIQEIFKYYLVFGGFIKYYKELDLNFQQSFEQNFNKLIKKQNLFKQEYDLFFDGIFSERKMHKEIVEIILQKKNVNFDTLVKELSKKKPLAKKTIEEQLLELKRNNIIRETRFLGERNFYCCHPILYFFFHLGKAETTPNYIQWRGDMFEIIVAENISVIMRQIQDAKFEFKLNHQIKESDLIDNGSEKIVGQYDLIAEILPKNRYYKKRSYSFAVFEVKFQEEDISLQQKEKLKARAEAFELYLQERKPELKNKQIQVKSFFVTSEEKNKYGMLNLPELMLSIPEEEVV